jgi:hypothetical protein
LIKIDYSLTAEDLGVSKNSYVPYSKKDDAYVEENYYKVSLTEMARHLGRTCNSVRLRASKLGVARKRGHNVKVGRARPMNMLEIPEVIEQPRTIAEIMDEIVGSKMWATAEEIAAYEKAAVARAHEILGGADA